MMSSVWATLLIGIPSVGIAALTLVFARHAHAVQMASTATRETAAGIAAEAGAYTRARDIDESAIAELRRQVVDLRAEVAQLRSEAEDARARLQQAQAIIDELRTTVAMLRTGGKA